MNTLGSWIDQDNFSQTAQTLVPTPNTAGDFASLLGPAHPLSLGVEDFRPQAPKSMPMASTGGPAHDPTGWQPPTPETATEGFTPEELERMRALLEETRRRAAASGLLTGSVLDPRPLPQPNSLGEPTPAQLANLPTQRQRFPLLGANQPSVSANQTPAPVAPVHTSASSASLPQPPSQRAENSPAPAAPPPPRRSLAFFEPPLGPLGTRIRAFVDWLKRQIDTEEVFIADAQGCPVTDGDPSPQLLASALLLAETACRVAKHLPSALESPLQIDLPENRKLCVIHAETTYGHFCLGFTLSAPLLPSAADRLRRTLKRTIEADSKPTPVRVEKW